MKKVILLVLLVLLIGLVILLLFLRKWDDGYSTEIVIEKIKVDEIPDGFIPLGNANDDLGNGLHYIPWASMLAFLDIEGVVVYSVGLGNREFIVQYNGVSYVNEKKLLELIELAAIAPEQRRKIYSMEDAVEIRGSGDTAYTLKIDSVELVETKPGDDRYRTTYAIKYTLTSNTNEELRYCFITNVETNDGKKYNVANSENTGIMSIAISKDTKITAVIAQSPYSPGLTYRIVVE